MCTAIRGQRVPFHPQKPATGGGCAGRGPVRIRETLEEQGRSGGGKKQILSFYYRLPSDDRSSPKGETGAAPRGVSGRGQDCRPGSSPKKSVGGSPCTAERNTTFVGPAEGL